MSATVLGGAGQWEQSHNAILRLDAALKEVIPSIGNTETTPNLPQYVSPPTGDEDPTEYLDNTLAVCIATISMSFQYGRDSLIRTRALENRIYAVEKALVDLTAEVKKQGREIERQCRLCQEVLAGQRNAAALRKNAQVYRSSSRIHPLTAQSYDEDGTPKWETHPHFPKTLIEFKKLRHTPGTVKDLLEYYEVWVYRDGSSSEATDVMVDNPHSVQQSMRECLEELAVAFGMDLGKIGDLDREVLKDV